MFEQKPSTLQNNSSLAPSLEPPANLPVADGNPKSNEPEDILAEIDSSKADVRGPSQADDFSMPSIPAMPSTQKTEVKEPFFKKYKKIFVIITLVVIAGAIVGTGSWYAYKMLSGQPEVNQNTNQPEVNQNTNQSKPAVDTDRDGLSDEDEALYGTDIRKVDTDSDGLTDRDETKIFETDPLNPDTDGDGFTDGEEVRNNYNPKGEGRLLNVQ